MLALIILSETRSSIRIFRTPCGFVCTSVPGGSPPCTRAIRMQVRAFAPTARQNCCMNDLAACQKTLLSHKSSMQLHLRTQSATPPHEDARSDHQVCARASNAAHIQTVAPKPATCTAQQSCIHRCHTHKQEFLREASNSKHSERDEHVKAQPSAAHWMLQKGLIC